MTWPWPDLTFLRKFSRSHQKSTRWELLIAVTRLATADGLQVRRGGGGTFTPPRSACLAWVPSAAGLKLKIKINWGYWLSKSFLASFCHFQHASCQFHHSCYLKVSKISATPHTRNPYARPNVEQPFNCQCTVNVNALPGARWSSRLRTRMASM